MKIYFLSALIITVFLVIIYLKYQKTKDTKQILGYFAAAFAVIFFTYAGKVIFVHKPIFIFHLAFLILSWGALFYYVFKDKLNLLFLLSPAITTVSFIIIALFFSEHG